MTTPESSALNPLRCLLSAKERFDRLAGRQDAASRQQVSLRYEMLAALSGMSLRLDQIDAISEFPEPSDAARLRELNAANLDALDAFDRACSTYAHLRLSNRSDTMLLVETLADYLRAEDALCKEGNISPVDFSAHFATYRRLLPHARQIAGIPGPQPLTAAELAAGLPFDPA